ncbi:unnamed protein product [Adineta steineri]|uniref:protein-serine/threonine phosphatase n=1 Tax=Adineta steineri TaxID=433720 RepID=A0A818GD44_9BILA|nr:unnamed protein product [Adineta steineri]CAF3489766.1 unnamed protein product [Adineta steineri]
MALEKDASMISTMSTGNAVVPVLVDYNLSQITPNVFVTAENTARQYPMIFSSGINCVINVADELPHIIFPPGVESLKFPILDIPTFPASQYFDIVADRIAANTATNRRTLLYCHHGRSRSITFILAYLIKHHQLSLPTAFALVKDKRQIALPNVGFWSQLRTYEYYQRLRQYPQYQQIISPIPMIKNLPEPVTYGQEVLNKLSDGLQKVLARDPITSAFSNPTLHRYRRLYMQSNYPYTQRKPAPFMTPFHFKPQHGIYQKH